jgi:hypothetical protein
LCLFPPSMPWFLKSYLCFQVSKTDMDRLVMQYLVTEGYKVRALIYWCNTPPAVNTAHSRMPPQEAAEQFALDTNIQPEVELTTIGAPPAPSRLPHNYPLPDPASSRGASARRRRRAHGHPQRRPGGRHPRCHRKGPSWQSPAPQQTNPLPTARSRATRRARAAARAAHESPPAPPPPPPPASAASAGRRIQRAGAGAANAA